MKSKTIIPRISAVTHEIYIYPDYSALPAKAMAELSFAVAQLAEQTVGEAAKTHVKILAALGQWHMLYRTDKGRSLKDKYLSNKHD